MKRLIKIVDFLALLLYCAAIYWLSNQANLIPPFDFGFKLQDKLYHAGAYFIMAVFAWRSFKHAALSSTLLVLATVSFCSLYGASDEWHQSFIVNRFSDVGDWLADTLGALIAAFLLYQLQKRSTAKLSAIQLN